MPTLKERLLEALDDTSWNDLPEAALVEVLLEQSKRAKKDLFEAQQALIEEGVRADDIQRNAHDEIRELRSNPLAAARGDFYFYEVGSNVAYIVSIDGRSDIRLVRQAGRIDYRIQRLSREEFTKLTKELI